MLLHTKVRDGASKAKIERSWRTLKETWLYKLDIGSIHSLAQFNGLLKEYMRSYNTSFHSGIGCAPMDRYLKTKDQAKVPESREWLDECFLNRIKRRVKKDSTISIRKVSYDVPMQFIGQTVEIRFQPDDMSTAFALYDGKRFPVRPTNRVENCHTKRNNIEIDYSKIGGES